MKLLNKINVPGVVDEYQPVARVVVALVALLALGGSLLYMLPLILGAAKIGIVGLVIYTIYKFFQGK